ncbi:ATP-binding protein [Ramlibacter rhizophilus]|nr:ATP-binding protein [Ramlibacter rhizophilus]
MEHVSSGLSRVRASSGARAALGRTWQKIVSRFGAVFLFHFVVIVAVLSLTTALFGIAFEHFVQRPRVRMAAEVYAANFEALVTAVQSNPVPERLALLRKLGQMSNDLVAEDDPTAWPLVEPNQLLVQDFLFSLRERLPRYDVAFTPGPRPLLWLSVPVDVGRTAWVRMDLGPFVSVRAAHLTIVVFLAVLTASAGTAYLITSLRRRLSWVAEALDRMDPRSGRLDTVPPVSPGSDPLELASHLRGMASRVAEVQAERTLLMVGVARDLEELVQNFRRAQPATTLSPEAARYADDMQRVVRRFSEFAQSPAGEEVQQLDLDPLLSELALQLARPDIPVRMQLGGLPYTDLRPSAARQIFGNLLDNAVRYGGEAVEVSSSVEHGWVVVRILDRGPGLTEQELVLVGRPFYRTERARSRAAGSGLGIAIARQQAEAHGGVVRLSPRPGGGLQVEVWLRPARLA